MPSDGRFVSVSIAGVLDADGDPVALAVTGITESAALHREPCADASALDDGSVELRAALGDRRAGRTYRVHFEADDGRGGRCVGTVSACVPSAKEACSDQDAALDATAPGCTALCASACAVERSLGTAACAGEDVPGKLRRSVERARRRMVRAAAGRNSARWLAAGYRSIDRAARLVTMAVKAHALSPGCAEVFGEVLSRARAGGDQGIPRALASSPAR